MAAATLALTAPPLLAQQATPAPQDDPGLETITVTATRRSATDVQTTPVAVTALNDAIVEDLSGNDLGDIASLVPNFSTGKPAGFNAAAFAIRGVGQTSIIVYADAHVGVAVDDFVIPHIQTQALDLFDIEQVEVLRGPQGTLFGKNTTGGVIAVTSKRPVLGEYGAETQVSYGQYNNGADNASLKAILSDALSIHEHVVHPARSHPLDHDIHRPHRSGQIDMKRKGMSGMDDDWNASQSGSQPPDDPSLRCLRMDNIGIELSNPLKEAPDSQHILERFDGACD